MARDPVKSSDQSGQGVYSGQWTYKLFAGQPR